MNRIEESSVGWDNIFWEDYNRSIASFSHPDPKWIASTTACHWTCVACNTLIIMVWFSLLINILRGFDYAMLPALQSSWLITCSIILQWFGLLSMPLLWFPIHLRRTFISLHSFHNCCNCFKESDLNHHKFNWKSTLALEYFWASQGWVLLCWFNWIVTHICLLDISIKSI